MRTNKQELDRLRIKSELGQKMMSYQQNKNTEKAEEEKNKYFLKQQIMEDILRKKYKPQQSTPVPPPPPQVESKEDSKLYSFGFPNHQSYLSDYQSKQSQFHKSKQYENSQVSQQSSMPFIDAMRNKYIIPPEDEDQSRDLHPGNYLDNDRDQESNDSQQISKNRQQQQIQNQRSQSHYQTQKDEQQYQSNNPSVQFIDKQIPSNSYTFDANKGNRYNLDNNSSSKYQIENRSYKYEINNKSFKPQVDNKSNKYQLDNKSSKYQMDNKSSKYQIDNKSNKYEIDSKSNKYDIDNQSNKYEIDLRLNKYELSKDNQSNKYDIDKKSARYEMDNKSNRYDIQNKSNRYDVKSKVNEYLNQHSHVSSTPNILNSQKPQQQSMYDSYTNKNSQYNFMPTQVIQNKSRQHLKVDTLSHSKFIQSSLHNKPNTINYKRTHNEDNYDNKEEYNNYNKIDIAASNLSKQFMKNSNNNSGLIKGGYLSPSNIEPQKEQSGSFEKIAVLPPKPQKRDYMKYPQSQVQDEDNYNNQYQNVQQSYEQPKASVHKAYGGFIKQGQQNDQYLEELRKKKVMQFERKRLNRNQERKKSQQMSSKLQKQSNTDSEKKQGYSYGYKKQKQRKAEEYYNDNHSNHLPPQPPERKQIVNPKSRTSSQAEQRRSSIHQKASDRQRDKKASPNQVSSIQSSSSKGLLKTPKSSIFELSPNRPKDKSLGRLFQDPKIEPKQRKQTFSKQSNKKMMINAITNVCLPGEINRKERQKLLDILQMSACEYFIFLFKEYSRNVVKAVYTYDSTSGEVNKIHGDKAPSEIHEEDVLKFMRFDSGAKQFKILDGCKSFSYAVHAIYIK